MATPTQFDTTLQPPAGSLAGRAREQAALDVQLTASLAGRGSLVLVGGEAGIGKTALVSWLASEARQRGSQVLTGHCHDLTQTPPYGPWREAFARMGMAGDQSGDPPPLQWGDDLGSITSQSLLFDQVHEFLVRETAYRPLTLVLEDMHWSDPASLELLLHVVRGIDSLPLLLIATYRDDEITAREPLFTLLPLLARSPHVERIDLGPLTADAVRDLVTRRYTLSVDDQARLVAYLHGRSGGNAFYVMELLRALEADRLLRPAADRWLLGELERAPVPRLVRQIIEGRLAKIDGRALELLEIAAVIGQDVPLDIWEAASGVERDRLAVATESALEARLIFEPSDTTSLRFTHALVRETLYRRQTLAERQVRHRCIAEILASRPDPPPSVVASHFAYGDDARAIDWLVRSGEQALALYAARDAITALTRAQELAGRFLRPLPPAAYRARAAAATLIGEFDAARRDYELALDRGRAIGDRHAEWQALLDLGMLWAERDYERTIGYYRAALALAHEIGDTSLIAYSLNHIANWHVNRDEPDEALLLHEEALALFEANGDRRGIAETLDFLALASYLSADLPASTAYSEQAIALLRELDDRRLLCSCLTTLSFSGGDAVCIAAPIFREESYWIRSSDEALRIARDIGWPAGEAFALLTLSMTRGARGDLGRALHEAEAALAIADRIDHRQWSVAAQVAVGAAWSELLDPTRAADALTEALAVARFSGFRFWITMVAATLASVQIAAGDLTRAGATLRTVSLPWTAALSLSHRQYWFASAELALASGEPDRALEIVDTMIARVAPIAVGGVISPLLKLRGDALGRLRRRAEARLAYQSAREHAAMHGFRPLLWRIDVARGELALADGRTAEATEAFQSARTVIVELAATIDDLPLREQFRKRASARLLRGQPSEQLASSPAPLSPRELDVLRLLVEGKSDREIGVALFISPRTVMRHVTGILNKLGVSSRTAAATLAVREGIV